MHLHAPERIRVDLALAGHGRGLRAAHEGPRRERQGPEGYRHRQAAELVLVEEFVVGAVAPVGGRPVAVVLGRVAYAGHENLRGIEVADVELQPAAGIHVGIRATAVVQVMARLVALGDHVHQARAVPVEAGDAVILDLLVVGGGEAVACAHHGLGGELRGVGIFRVGEAVVVEVAALPVAGLDGVVVLVAHHLRRIQRAVVRHGRPVPCRGLAVHVRDHGLRLGLAVIVVVEPAELLHQARDEIEVGFPVLHQVFELEAGERGRGDLRGREAGLLEFLVDDVLEGLVLIDAHVRREREEPDGGHDLRLPFGPVVRDRRPDPDDPPDIAAQLAAVGTRAAIVDAELKRHRGLEQPLHLAWLLLRHELDRVEKRLRDLVGAVDLREDRVFLRTPERGGGHPQDALGVVGRHATRS